MKDLTISITNISNNSNSINPLCDTTNSSSNTVEPVSSSAGWGVYVNQQTWADLHLR